MVELNRITFKGYFIHKNGIKSYRLLTVLDENIDESFSNLAFQEPENTILTVYGTDILIKSFETSKELIEFWKENIFKIKNKECKTYVNANALIMQVLEMININEYLKQDNKVLERIYKEKTEK